MNITAVSKARYSNPHTNYQHYQISFPTAPTSSALRFLHLSMVVATGLLFALSVTLLGLVSHSLAYINSNTVQGNTSISGDVPNHDLTILLLPTNLDNGSYWAMFAAGTGGTIDAILILLLIFRHSLMFVLHLSIPDVGNSRKQQL